MCTQAEDKMLLKEVGKAGEGDPHEVEKLIEEVSGECKTITG